jgi:glycine cleavage system H protein
MIRNTFKLFNSSITSGRLLNNNKRFSTTPVFLNKEYTESGEWIFKEEDYYKIGLTEKSANELGELVYLEFDKLVGDVTEFGEDLVIIESVKASASVYAPFNCEVIENNDKLVDNLELINQLPECEDSSWLLKVRKM